MLLWTLLWIGLQSHANTVLLQAPQTSNFEYRAMLKAHREYISPIQEHARAHPTPASRERLLSRFADAQAGFLRKTDAEAQERFIRVLDLLEQEDWDRGAREIFLQTYLRLAQMETDLGKRDRWLSLSLLLGDAGYESSLYPPPLLSRRAEILKSSEKMNFVKKYFDAGWSMVLVNGQPCASGECAAWPAIPGKIRVTVLSDVWQSQSAVVDSKEAGKRNFPRQAWVEGDCQASQLSAAANRMTESKVFWGLGCEASAPLNLKRATAPQEPLPLFTSAMPKSTPLLKNKWLWIGVATVATVIVLSNQHKSQSKEPTTSYGFN